MADPKTNIAASVRDRLKNEARKQGTTLNALLIRFGLERFLYRLSGKGDAGKGDGGIKK